MSDQRIGISKQQKKRKKDEEQNDTCAPNKRSKRGKGGNGIGSKPGKGPKGALAGGKGSKKGRPGQGKDPEEDTAADEGSDRENAGEEASEKESAAGDNINMDSAGGDGTRRASSDVENSADGANGGESGTDESDVEDIAGGSVGGTEDAVAGSTGEEDSIGEGMGGHDGNGLVGGQSAADRSVRAKDAAGGPNGEDDVADTGDGSTGVYDDPGRQDDIVTNSIEGDDATGGPTGRQDAKLAAAPLQDHDVNVADGWAARGADAADGPSAEVAARERTEGDDAKEGFEARGTGKDTRHGTIGQEETANGSTEGGELATDKIPGVQETAADYSDRTQDDTDVTTTQVEPLSTSIGAEDTAAQEAGQEDTAVAETARGQGDHIATKSAGGEVTIADQNAGKEDTAASGIAGEETTTPEEVVAADVLASLKTTGPLSGGNEVIVPQESPGLRLDVVNTEAGAQKNNGQRAMVEEAPENEADFSRTYQAAKPVDPPQTSGKKTPPQESPRTPRTRAAHARFPTMLPTPPQSDLRRILHQPKGMIAHPGSPKCLVDVPSDGEIDGESGEALAHQVSTYKAASHVSGDRMGTTSPDPLEKARNDTRKAIDEISTRLMKCEEIIAPPITSIPEIANGLRDIAAEMAGPYKRLRALKERAIMLHGQARR